jgi:UDP-N-acetylglucosamine--N-acetylmuramyl-(pentapeptide) pyrophosphoryl-undecaprenol N-acetylglucosamine transferase
MGVALLVANDGGHVKQLHSLAPRLPLPAEQLWVTIDSPQTRSLLAGQAVEHLRGSKPRDVLTAARNAVSAERLFREHDVELVVSTGSSLAVAVLPLAVRRRIETVYIESATRIDGPSAAGRLLARLPPVRTLTQHARWADDRWRYRGSVMDGFARERGTAPDRLRRVVVTLGSSEHYGLRRLLERLVEVLPPDADVVWQTGSTDVTGLPIQARPAMPAAELTAAIQAADVVVAHAGTGSLVVALESGKLPVLVPRRAARGEHVDDHQEQIAAWASSMDLALAREADEVTLDDLLEAAASTVRRVDAPPPITW